MPTVLVGRTSQVRGYTNQILMSVFINVPTVSFGLAMGWVSGASVRTRGDQDEVLVWAAAGTFLAALLGMPVCARALSMGRKPTVIATSAAFAVCWGLKLVSTEGWWLAGARAAAGLGSSGAWTVAPLYVRELAEERLRGALGATVVLAQNLGYLLMYIAIDTLPQRTILWCCLSLSVCHCAVFALLPESPAYLLANGRRERAADVLSWLRGAPVQCPTLQDELRALAPPPGAPQSALQTARLIFRSPARRRALAISAVAVLGQEVCGVFALLHYAERVFTSGALSGDGARPGLTPARQTILLGAVQLVASVAALYLVERAGRKWLLTSSALTVSAGMAVAAACRAAGGPWAQGGAWALCGAIAADSLGLQPVPYVILTEMFHYQYRGLVVTSVQAVACLANALELAAFPALAARCGPPAALSLSAAATALYALFAAVCVPETRGLSPDEIYRALSDSHKPEPDSAEADRHSARGDGASAGRTKHQLSEHETVHSSL